MGGDLQTVGQVSQNAGQNIKKLALEASFIKIVFNQKVSSRELSAVWIINRVIVCDCAPVIAIIKNMIISANS
jgi:hypothetical protein